MNLQETLAQLEAMGTAQNRKVYGRHGVNGDQYGVSMANLKALKKQIKTDQALAEALWQTGNHDARILATMIADPRQLEAETLDRWAGDLDNYVIADAFSGLVAQTPLAQQKMEAWTQTEGEWIGQVGWNLVAHLAMKDKKLPDEYFRAYLGVIEREIHRRKNRVRYSMNNALIAMGLRSDSLRHAAIATARKVGSVEVEHGETNCQTPDAVEYIERAAARKKQ